MHKEKIRDQDEEVDRSEHETSVDETLEILEQIFADRQNPSAELFLSKFSLTGRLEEMRQMGNKVIRKHKKEKSELRTKWKKCAQSTHESALQMLHLDCTGCVRPQKGQMNEMLDLQVTCHLEKKLLELVLPLRFAEEEEQAKDELQALGISENIVDGMRLKEVELDKKAITNTKHFGRQGAFLAAKKTMIEFRSKREPEQSLNVMKKRKTKDNSGN